jgi:chitodextrinase
MHLPNRSFLSTLALALLLGACGRAPAQTVPPVPAAPDPASIVWSCSFATSFTGCGFSEQALVPGRATIVNVARDGTTGVRLHTEPGDSNIFGSGASERNDLQLADSASACTQGQESWWAHSVFFPDDFVQVPESTGSAWNFGVVLDFHQVGAAGPTLWELDAMPAAALSPDRPTGLQFVGHGGDPNNPTVYGAAIGPIVKNVWYDFVYHVKWSSGSDGFFYAWVNGVQKLSYTGPTLYTGDSCYLKLANYHSPTGQPSSIIHDRVIRGSTPNAVALTGLQGVTMALAASSPDTTAPTTPTGLSVTAVSPSQIGLSWAASTDDVGVTGYRVNRGGALLTTVGTVTTLQNTGLSPSTTYTYTVQAVDAAGNASGQSAAASATTPPALDTMAPSTPTGLVASASSPSQISLSWAASTDDVGVSGYRVYRGGALLIALGPVTAWQNTGLSPATTYSYTVQAIDAAGNASAQSTAASATTPAALVDIIAPSTPGGLTASAVSSSQISLSWAASTDDVGVTSYRVYRNGVLLLTLGAVTSLQNTGLSPSTAYSYTVQAIDAAGNASAQSVAASATTPAAADTTAPSVPTALKATAVSGTQINLTWKASTDNIAVAGYTVYLNDAMLATTTARSFSHTGLKPGTTYSYRVSAFDAAHNKSAWTATPVTATTPVRRVARGDFNGDGKSDVLWRNAATGANTIWLMSGATVATNAAAFSTVADATWSIAGVGDFDGNGKADVLWHNSASGANVIWLMNGSAIVSDVAAGSMTDPAWSVAAVSDFDGDGKADILWRNAATGAVTLWLMNSGTVTGNAAGFAAMADLNWIIAAVADFDGDGKADILWRNGATGDNLLWSMNGATIVSALAVNAVPDLTWSVAGAGDFDGDGKADILWRNQTSGQNSIWFMNGAAMTSGPLITAMADMGWSIAGTGDFDGDGKADILWRNTATGQDAIWFMNGATLSNGPSTGTLDSGWSIAFP